MEFPADTPGVYTGALSFDTNEQGNSPFTLLLSGTVSAMPMIELSESDIVRSVPVNLNLPDTTFTIRNSEPGAMPFEVSANRTWISVTPQSGTATQDGVQINVTLNNRGLSPGKWRGEITVTSATAANNPQTIPVELQVTGLFQFSDLIDWILDLRETPPSIIDLNGDDVSDAADLVQ